MRAQKIPDDKAAFRARIAAIVATLKPAEAFVPPRPVTDADLKIPKHLRRKKVKRTDAELARLLGTDRAREWAPLRKRGEWSEKPEMPLLTNDPHLPVRVQVKGKEVGSVLLATYANMEEFNAKHNKASYPVKRQPVTLDGTTIILVTAKPWAGKKDDAQKRQGPAGPAKSAVRVGATLYGSVLKAFEALKLPISKHQKFRAELKKAGKLAFTHDGVDYAFNTNVGAEPEPVVAVNAKAQAAAKKGDSVVTIDPKPMPKAGGEGKKIARRILKKITAKKKGGKK
jgi:hypothetical protein